MRWNVEFTNKTDTTSKLIGNNNFRTIQLQHFLPWFLALGSWLLVLGSWFLDLISWFLVLGSWFLVPGSWFYLLLFYKASN
jgi:hypothetical protein